MFETDDLMLRKNEKNFILCLLEVARFGARFGMQVPTLIRYEQEIEAEMEMETAVNDEQLDVALVSIEEKAKACLVDEFDAYLHLETDEEKASSLDQDAKVTRNFFLQFSNNDCKTKMPVFFSFQK